MKAVFTQTKYGKLKVSHFENLADLRKNFSDNEIVMYFNLAYKRDVVASFCLLEGEKLSIKEAQKRL